MTSGVGSTAVLLQTAGPLPLATPPPTAPTLSGMFYGLGRVDASGRVSDRCIADHLGWRPGDRLTITATAAAVTARRDPDGMVTLPHRRCLLVVPAALRHRCGISVGDRVLLVATLTEDRVAVYPLATVHELLTQIVGEAPGGERP